MEYVSTRGNSPTMEFSDVLLAGLAPDGGLFLPAQIPDMPDLGTAEDYAEAAFAVTRPYVEPAIPADDWGGLLERVYARFDTPEVTPLVDLGDDLHLLELFHGPTFAFKDMAMQVLGDLFEYELNRRGETVTVVGATSGDTGAAAVEALKDRAGIELFMLHPDGGVSDVQRRQMTTCQSPNIHNLAVAGSFDDCQDAVKAMFSDETFRSRHRLSAVNSINWARVMMQIVYYAVSIARLGGPVTFSVPTGNFGNVYAGHVARRMGAGVNGLIVASNRNDILTRFHLDSVMEIREVIRTTSPSMDIQISSNFERFVFEALAEDGAATAQFIQDFRSAGRVANQQVADAYRAGFEAAMLTDEEGAAVIADLDRHLGVLVDPHTAIGIGAAQRIHPEGTVVALATAHPAKFGSAIEEAIGRPPPVPARIQAALEASEKVMQVPNDVDTIKAVVGAGRQEF